MDKSFSAVGRLAIIRVGRILPREGKMRTETTGTIVAGGLQLDAPIDLPDKSRVRVAVEPLEERPSRFPSGVDAWIRGCS
jgi:hypothetical protein